MHRALERGIEGFERIVALKRLLPHLAEDASFIKSFVREAKLASFLNHVNIVQIFELGRVGAEYFISMEYIDGRDIRRLLRHARKVTGPPPIHVTVGMLLQLCDALDYAHAKTDEQGQPLGLVHRDVSPSNLIVTLAGHLKVIDFGIAKAQSQQHRTQTGRVKGKLAYMAPEAISGRELDSRSDLFAAGVITHELLTARPLFASKNEYQTLLKVQRGDIMPPSTFNQSCPPELDAIALRALARDPDERFATAGEMRDELHALRRRYNLQTGHLDVAEWLTWAFSIEAPSGGIAAPAPNEPSLSFDARSARRTPSPRKEDEEAVEIAWGGGEEPGTADPVMLEDVPDVSEKHLAPDRFLGAAPALDALDAMPALVTTSERPGDRPGERSIGEIEARPARSLTNLAIGEGLDDDDETVATRSGTSRSTGHYDATEPQLPLVRFRTPTLPHAAATEPARVPST
ncbi:MAG: serine/threonine protein kinase, partial [Deltaproteobacteria bacterium]|nr:serine/threonine protein kinase [Deltaproteobacteria bacterium]